MGFVEEKITSDLLPWTFNCRFVHSFLRSSLERGRYAFRISESRSLEGRPAFAVEEIDLRMAWVNLVTGGVTLDMMNSMDGALGFVEGDGNDGRGFEK